jgi:hypothetical protein
LDGLSAEHLDFQYARNYDLVHAWFIGAELKQREHQSVFVHNLRRKFDGSLDLTVISHVARRLTLPEAFFQLSKNVNVRLTAKRMFRRKSFQHKAF